MDNSRRVHYLNPVAATPFRQDSIVRFVPERWRLEDSMKKDQHVIPNPRGGWSVRHSGATRATRVFNRQEDAVKYARGIAKKENTELYVHRRDGTIREKDSYGRDPSASGHKQ
jgi:hypothetical protein